MKRFTETTIEIRTPTTVGRYGLREIPAMRLGDWAAHRSVDMPGQYVITLLPLGLVLPPDFATFLSIEAACRATASIARLRNDWHQIVQADLTPALRDRIKAICARCGAIDDAPVGIQAHADKSLFGRTMSARPNGYEQPAVV